MRSFFIYFIAAASAVALAAVSGCKQGAAPAPQAQVAFTKDVTFEDIPVPGGFKLERNKSYSFQNDVTRVGHLVYEGRSSINNVLAFYQQQMPLHGWQEMSYIDFRSSVRIFDKEGQRCILTVQPSAGWHNVRILLSVQPKSR